MKRLRLLFAAVALAVLLPLMLLISRALASAEAERALERRTVAERLIDEMERELTAFLRREEDRPFGHYRYLARPDDGPPGAAEALSPFTAALEPFVVAPFQLAPDGTASTPLWPDDLALARRSGWHPNKEARYRADQVLAAVAGAFPARLRFDPGTARGLEGEEARKELPDQRAGTTVELNVPSKVPAEQQRTGGPLELLEKLNRGAEPRAERSSKLSKTQSTNLQQEEKTRLVDLRLEPMVGRPLGEKRMLLYRTVFAGPVAYRQGLLIDRRKLVEWLAERSLSGAGAARVSIEADFGTAAEPAADEGVFRHRFAEPFSPVAALVRVGGAEGGALANARLLSALLLAAALLGLFALYRMAAYALAYAQRRGDFVAAVTHELKTPLTAIRMYGEMLRDGMVEDEQKKKRYYETIVAEGERLSRLVDNVLELARLERKEKGAAAAPAAREIGPLLEEAAALLRPHAEKEGFALELALEPGLPAVAADRDLLLQIVFNLVDNAIKYARSAAEKTVSIGARREAGGVLVEVADRGPGVPPQHLRRIFEPFWRGESELTRTTKGTGIGLALVAGLGARMGARIAARNRDGGGFAVSLQLPAAGSRTIPPP